MRKAVVAGVLVAATATFVVLITAPRTEHHHPPGPVVSQTLVATTHDRTMLWRTFLSYKRSHHEMAASDRFVWSRVEQKGPLAPLVAYDALDHHIWALATFSLVLPASYVAEVAAQDGGSTAVFTRPSTGRWIMKGHAGLPLCPSAVPKVVAQLWGLKDWPACHS